MANEAKRFLYSVRDEVKEIKELQLRIEELESQAMSVEGISYDRVHVQTSPQDVMSEKVAELYDYQNDLMKKVNTLNRKRRKAQRMINRLDDSKERQVLDLFFLSNDRMSMEDVGRIMGYSEREA